MTIHENCGGNGYEQVTCDRCGRTYTCTPSDDYYCGFPEGDHCCERCLLKGMSVKTMTVVGPVGLPGGAA